MLIFAYGCSPSLKYITQKKKYHRSFHSSILSESTNGNDVCLEQFCLQPTFKSLQSFESCTEY